MENDYKAQHQDESDGGVDGGDEKAHHSTSNQAERGRVPAEVPECRPVEVVTGQRRSTLQVRLKSQAFTTPNSNDD